MKTAVIYKGHRGFLCIILGTLLDTFVQLAKRSNPNSEPVSNYKLFIYLFEFYYQVPHSFKLFIYLWHSYRIHIKLRKVNMHTIRINLVSYNSYSQHLQETNVGTYKARDY